MVERLKASFYALFRAAVPRLDYYALYDGKVVAWHPATQTVDIQTSDPRLPSMSEVPFKHGAPGETVSVAPGTRVLVGWENGDPSRDFAATWSGGESVRKRVLNADEIILGGEAGAEFAAKGVTLQTYLNSLTALLITHAHSGVTTGPGASGPAPTLAALVAPNITATNVKVK